jgi:hypothetical protein
MNHRRINQFCEETFATVCFVDIVVILAADLNKRKIFMATDTPNTILTVTAAFF